MGHIRNTLTVFGAAVVLGACGTMFGTNPNEGLNTNPLAEGSAAGDSASTTIPDPYSLVDLVDAHTTLASITNTLLDNNDYGGDIVAPEFTCRALANAASYAFAYCVIAGTSDSPFALIIGDEYVDRQRDTARTSLLYQVLQPVPDAGGVRAVKVLGGTSNTELVSFDSQELTIRSINTGIAGKAVALHFQVFGGSRTWNVIEMVGLNQFGTATVVARFTGEGVVAYADGRGFVFTNYHYGDNEPLCCASYYAINYFRPGAYGWTHSVRTVLASHDFGEFASSDLVAKYTFARGFSNDG